MRVNDPEFEYVAGQGRPGFPALLAEYEALGEQVVAREPCTLDVRYGRAARETFDFFAASEPATGTLLYFHAGYWQSRDKSGFRFIAPAFTRRGLNVALVNYPLCPSVTLAALVDSARKAASAIRAHVNSLAPGRELPLIVSGHSAGAHIATELALTRPALGVAAVIALSGIYDLAPLLDTSLNSKLGLDVASARANSPLFRVTPGAPAGLFVAGADETSAFLEQSRKMHEAWLLAGNRSVLEIVPGADHFTLLKAFTASEGALAARVAELLQWTRRPPA